MGLGGGVDILLFRHEQGEAELTGHLHGTGIMQSAGINMHKELLCYSPRR